MTPTMLNLFFVQEMLKPINPRAWESFLRRARYASDPELRAAVSAASCKRAREHPEKVNATARARYAKDPTVQHEATKKWNRKNPERLRKYDREWKRKRQGEDPAFKLLCYLRTQVCRAVKTLKKSAKTKELLGMGLPEFKIYMQGQFSPGMTWKNYGPVWHIDHIRPCASFDLSDPEQQRACFNWSNMQPLFAQDNLKKWAHYV